MRPGCAANAELNSSQAGSAPIIASNSFPEGPSNCPLITSTAFASSKDRLLFLSVSVLVGSHTSKERLCSLNLKSCSVPKRSFSSLKQATKPVVLPFANPKTLSLGASTVTSRSLWA